MIALQAFAKNLTRNVQANAAKASKKTKPADDHSSASSAARAETAPTANTYTNNTAASFYPPLDTDILDIDILEEDLDVFGLEQTSNSLQRHNCCI